MLGPAGIMEMHGSPGYPGAVEAQLKLLLPGGAETPAGHAGGAICHGHTAEAGMAGMAPEVVGLGHFERPLGSSGPTRRASAHWGEEALGVPYFDPCTCAATLFLQCGCVGVWSGIVPLNSRPLTLLFACLAVAAVCTERAYPACLWVMRCVSWLCVLLHLLRWPVTVKVKLRWPVCEALHWSGRSTS